MKILHVVNWINVRGTERACLNIAKYSQGHEHVFLAHSVLDDETRAEFVAHGEVVIAKEIPPLSFNYPDLPQYVEREGIDLVHIYLPGDELPDYVKFLTVPVVLTVVCTKRCYFERTENMVEVLAPSEFAASINAHLSPKVINYGVGKVPPTLTRDEFFSQHLPGVPMNALIVSRVGAIEPIKHPEDFILICNAFFGGGGTHQDLVFIMAGKGEDLYIGQLLQGAHAAHDQRYFVLFRDVSEETKANLLEHTDVYLYPTEFEAFGFSVVEPMSYGKPVLTYDNTALPEVVGDGGICIPNNDVRLLAGALGDLLTDENKRSELGKKGFNRWRDRFKPEVYAKNVLEIYEKSNI